MMRCFLPIGKAESPASDLFTRRAFAIKTEGLLFHTLPDVNPLAALIFFRGELGWSWFAWWGK